MNIKLRLSKLSAEQAKKFLHFSNLMPWLLKCVGIGRVCDGCGLKFKITQTEVLNGCNLPTGWSRPNKNQPWEYCEKCTKTGKTKENK